MALQSIFILKSLGLVVLAYNEVEFNNHLQQEESSHFYIYTAARI